MTFGQATKFGCLGIIGFFVLAAIIGFIGEALESPQQKAAAAAKRTAAAAQAQADEQAAATKLNTSNAQAATDLLAKLTRVRRRLPQVEAIREIPPPSQPPLSDIAYEPADYAFFAQFAETGFVAIAKDAPVPWYRGQILDDVEQTLTATDQTPEKRNAALAHEAADLATKPCLVVFLPLAQALPKVDADQKGFVAGYFNGWEIVLDAKKEEPLCQVRFSSTSSAKVSKTRLKVEGIPLGAGIKSAIGEDFTANFWTAANHALLAATASPTVSP